MFNPSSDLTATQNIIIADAASLSLLDLTGKTSVEIAKRIIKRSQWSGLKTNERYLCIYFRPARKLVNKKFSEEVLEIDCHVPVEFDYIAYQVQERVFLLLNEKPVNKRYLYFDGQLGELPTMSGFFCVGSKYCFNRKV